MYNSSKNETDLYQWKNPVVPIGTFVCTRNLFKEPTVREKNDWQKIEGSWNWLRQSATPSLSIGDGVARIAKEDATQPNTTTNEKGYYSRYFIYVIFTIKKQNLYLIYCLYCHPAEIKSLKLIYSLAQWIISVYFSPFSARLAALLLVFG